MIDEDLHKFYGSRVKRTITICRVPIRNLHKSDLGINGLKLHNNLDFRTINLTPRFKRPLVGVARKCGVGCNPRYYTTVQSCKVRPQKAPELEANKFDIDIMNQKNP
ncbi:hypothetical protein AVEN_182418-1 [Araneus ventricosus]|uniref:Uncharacterized protein n=1 Tax=Araneus ventricosus TaxID=182803 RepID=A0A4Y2LAU7_ARAVE|nr:hypothetical protein AVEN_182418-1 [Araneus ventricosus]